MHPLKIENNFLVIQWRIKSIFSERSMTLMVEKVEDYSAKLRENYYP